jgi:hypothetical protein
VSTDFLAGNRIVPVVVIEEAASAGKLGVRQLLGRRTSLLG